MPLTCNLFWDVYLHRKAVLRRGPPWLAGTIVQTDDIVAQIETDKVTIDMRYTGSKPGALKSLQISEGQEVEVNQVVGVVDDDVAAVEAAGGTSAQHVRPSLSKSVSMMWFNV